MLPLLHEELHSFSFTYIFRKKVTFSSKNKILGCIMEILEAYERKIQTFKRSDRFQMPAHLKEVCLFVKTQMINVFFSETKLSETFAILVYKLIRAVTIQQYPPTVFDIAKGIQNCKHLHSQIRKQQYGQIQFLCFYYVISREIFHCIAGIKVATASYKVPQQFRMEEMEQLSIQINSYCNCIL